MRGYSHYRGRRTPLGKKLAVAGMIAVLLLCCAYLAVSQYAEYDSEGNLSFDLPWQREESGGQEQEKVDVSLVKKEPADPLEEMHAVGLSAATLRSRADEGAWWEKEGYNAVILRLKEKDGMLWYASSAAPEDRVREDALTSAELETLLQSGVYTAAKISCFRDSAAALADMAGMGLCQSSGYIWYDNENGHWLDPGKDAAAEYLLALCEELAELGFDEIVLENVGYPVQGRLSKAAPVETDREKRIGDFLERAVALTKERRVRLSLVLEEETLLVGGNETSGLALDAALEGVRRVYVASEDPAAAEAALRQVSETAVPVFLNEEEGARCTVLP